MEIVRLTFEVYRSILKHARRSVPAEAVGLLGGPAPGYATHSIPLPNTAGHNAFLADPFAQFQAERELARLGLPLVAVYHSHPGGGTQLSSLDLRFARQRACFQIVIALARTGLPGEEMRAYQVVENVPVEAQVQIQNEE